MEKSRFLKIVIIALLVLNLGTLSFLFINHLHGKGHHGPPHDQEGPARFIIEKLGFDEKQQAAFNDLKREHQGQMRMMEDSIKMQRDQLPELITSGNDAKADSVATAIGRCQKQIERYTYQHFVKVYALCNDQQKDKFKDIIGEILHMMGRRGGPPPPER